MAGETRQVKDFPNCTISSDGVLRGPCGIRRPIILYGGYHHVNLKYKNKTRSTTIHRLVLEAFVGPCPPGCEARHLNGNPGDNRLENLAWGTKKQNAADRKAHGRHITSCKLTPTKVVETRKLMAEGVSHKQIAKLYHISAAICAMIRYNKIWTDVPWDPEVWTKVSAQPYGSTGERNSNHRFTNDDIREIRRMCIAGIKRSVIAERFGTTEDYVYWIASGRRWQHVS
jgi:hypothetical protein